MKVLVFGANGKVGRFVVADLVARGHSVTAFVRSSPADRLDQVTYVTGNIYHPADIERVLGGTEAVVSALGSWGTKKKNVLSTAMQTLIPMMHAAKIRRIISLTGADAIAPGEKHGVLAILSHVAFGLIAGKVLRDGEEHIRLLQDSDLDWTVLRSPVMNEVGGLGYGLSDQQPAPWNSIHRQAVARAMVEQIEQSNHYRSAPYLHRHEQ